MSKVAATIDNAVQVDESQFAGHQTYSKAGYVRMMHVRTGYLLALVEAGVRVLLFETDCLWLRDPLPEVLALQHTQHADIVATKVPAHLVCFPSVFRSLVRVRLTIHFSVSKSAMYGFQFRACV